MTISGTDLGKKFSNRWIFKNIDLVVPNASSLAIVGANGSGKSTLLQILANALTPSKGAVSYSLESKNI